MKQVGMRVQGTLFMVLHGVFGLLLSRYGNSREVVIGTPVANRMQKELERLVGFFVNTLVMRTESRPEERIGEYLERVKRVNLEAQANQDVPFEYLVERLKPRRSTSYGALFQIMMSMDTNEVGEVELKGLRMRPERSERIAVKFDLTMDVMEQGGGLSIGFGYNRDLFDGTTIERMSEHFKNLARGVVSRPERRIGELSLLGESEQEQLLKEAKGTWAEYPREKCLHQLFEAQVEQSPKSVAVVFEGSHLTYLDLNYRANQVAHFLRAKGIVADTLVGLCMERSLEMVVGILGILKAGGAYVPLDPAYPRERLEYMIADSAPEAVLTQVSVQHRLPGRDGPTLCLDADREVLDDYPTDNPRLDEVGVRPEHLAYVIYTSGSTGRPKGVAINHANVVNFICWGRSAFDADLLDRTLFSTSINFDLSVYECFVPLTTGAAIEIVENVLDLGRLPIDVTLINTVPSAITTMLDIGCIPKSVRMVNLAGEPLGPELVELVAVPDTGWDQHALSWANAPVLGRVVQSVRPAADDSRVIFDLSGALAEPGVYAFAVTVPPDRGHATFVGADGSTDQPVLHLPSYDPPPSYPASPSYPAATEAYPTYPAPSPPVASSRG